MALIRVTSLQDFLGQIGKRHPVDGSRIYRGVRDARFKLIPKVGRMPGYSSRRERDCLLLFKKYGVPFLNYRPKDDWEWLVIGQHHGLPTRLLDWTSNPLVAAYFAAEGSPETDCAIYAMRAPMVVDTDRDKNPLARGTGVDVVTPDHVSNRIAAQAGMFTIHWQPEKPVQSGSID